MKQHKLSAAKRLTKPILFGTVLLGLATAFINRHMFFEDVEVLRAQERARNESKLIEVLERRQRQKDELAENKKPAGSEQRSFRNLWVDYTIPLLHTGAEQVIGLHKYVQR